MTRRYELTDQQWEQIAILLSPEKTNKPRRPSKDNRLMINTMIWMVHSGALGVISHSVMAPGKPYTADFANGLNTGFWIISSGCSAWRRN